METDIFDRCINVIWVEPDGINARLYEFIEPMNIHVTPPPIIYETTRV